MAVKAVARQTGHMMMSGFGGSAWFYAFDEQAGAERTASGVIFTKIAGESHNGD